MPSVAAAAPSVVDAAPGNDRGGETASAAAAVGGEPALSREGLAHSSADSLAEITRYYVNEEGRISWRVVHMDTGGSSNSGI